MTGMSLSTAVLVGIFVLVALKLTLVFIIKLLARILGVVLGLAFALIAAPFVLTKRALTARKHSPMYSATLIGESVITNN